jgi:predicted ATPase
MTIKIVCSPLPSLAAPQGACGRGIPKLSQSYRKALSIAEEQGAKLWESRAAVSLARLRRGQGPHTEARDLLAPIYGWFTERFDTADLKEAKAAARRTDVIRSSARPAVWREWPLSGRRNRPPARP